MNDSRAAYQEARELLATLLGQASGAASATVAAAHAHLRRHCRSCGRPLDGEAGDEAPLCPDCSARALAAAGAFDAGGLERVLAASQVPADLHAPLSALLLTTPEHALCRFNAYWLAEQLNVPRRRVLAALAPAVVGGVLDLHWELYCLFCFNQQPAFASLGSAQSRQTCKHCHLTYDAPLDQEIIITFTPSPAIRPLGAEAYDRHWQRQVNERYGVVTAHELLTIQAFHDLFVNEPPPIHESFTVKRLALLFTDLGGSTALYARQGDPRAYALVREHFELLTARVAAGEGAVVKTIGDAIMAVFPADDLALPAALEAQRAIRGFNAAHNLSGQEALQLKIGLHAGPCLAVALNDRLDYFGTTVNATARLQKLALPGEVVFTAEVLAGLKDRAPLAGLALDEETVILRGLDDRPFTIYRCRP